MQSEQQQQSAEYSFKLFCLTRWFVVPAVSGTTFLIRQFLVRKKTVNNRIFVAPPLRPVSPLSSRCILGIETTFKTLSWNQFLFDRQEDAGERRWRREKERNEASLSISTPFSLSQETVAGLCWFHINNKKKKEECQWFLFIKHDAAILDCFHSVNLDQRFFEGFQFHSPILFWEWRGPKWTACQVDVSADTTESGAAFRSLHGRNLLQRQWPNKQQLNKHVPKATDFLPHNVEGCALKFS